MRSANVFYYPLDKDSDAMIRMDIRTHSPIKHFQNNERIKSQYHFVNNTVEKKNILYRLVSVSAGFDALYRWLSHMFRESIKALTLSIKLV